MPGQRYLFPVIAASLFAVSAAAQQKPASQSTKSPAAVPVAAATTPTVTPANQLPGGASSLTEQHGDWSVACTMAQGAKQCTFSQAIGNAQTGARQLQMQLRPAAADRIGGIVITPFGLQLQLGVRLAVDDKPLVGPLAFLTCVEGGCIVPLSFDANAIAAIKTGTSLKFSAVSANNGQPVTATLSLTGFSEAWSRATELLK